MTWSRASKRTRVLTEHQKRLRFLIWRRKTAVGGLSNQSDHADIQGEGAQPSRGLTAENKDERASEPIRGAIALDSRLSCMMRSYAEGLDNMRSQRVGKRLTRLARLKQHETDFGKFRQPFIKSGRTEPFREAADRR
jgi:hypothetical protein